MYQHQIDLGTLVALDTHVHIEADDDGNTALPKVLLDAADAYFGGYQPKLSLDEIAELYRERSMAAVVFTVDATTTMKTKPNSSEEIARGAAKNNDVLIPFGSVDPLLGQPAIDTARRLFEDFGVRGFKFHPSVQGFDPSDIRHYPLFEAIQEMGVPAVFHTGQTGIGAGLPGGFGIKLRYSNPMLLDDLVADLPALKVIMAHPSVPWQDEAISIATHKANVWLDLSGWSPKYFSANLVRNANSLLQDKVLFGSDFPAISPDRWLRDFAALDMKPHVVPKILRDNAIALLGLA